MKKKFTLMILLMIASYGLKAQVDFAPVGAEWYYEREYMNYDTWCYEGVAYDRFRSLDIVEINGLQCKEIELFQNIDCEGKINPYYEIRYISQEGEKVYEVIDGERHLLYDFGKNVGEYWVITHYGQYAEPDTAYVREISEITLEDGSTRRMFVTSLDGMGESALYCTNIIEGIGLDRSLFPFYELIGPPPCRNTEIRCYSENDNYLISSDVDCDSEEVSLEEYSGASIFCNTIIDDNLYIQFNDKSNNGYNVSVYDIIGNLIYKNICVDSSISIDLSNHTSEVYIIAINYDGNYQTCKIIKL